MQDQLYRGRKLLDWATLFAILFGPVLAVGSSLAVDARRNKRTLQIQTMRMLVGTRHLAGDPSYSSAIDLIPIEVNRQPKIMNAWRDYIEVVR